MIFCCLAKASKSTDTHVADIVILPSATFPPEFDGAMANVVAPERRRGLLTPAGYPQPAWRFYPVRAILTVGSKAGFSAARYQLRRLRAVDFTHQHPSAPVWRAAGWVGSWPGACSREMAGDFATRGRYGVVRATLLGALALLVLLVGCAGEQPTSPGSLGLPPWLATAVAVMDDGYRLPLRRWGDARAARGVVLALHGFNEYAGTFAQLGSYLAAHGFLLYAYDQRGFGATAGRGHWAGEEPLIADLRTLAALLHQRHPRLPLYLLGESMGGAVVMAAGTTADVAGVVLIAPAVWSRDTMPAMQRLALAIAADTVPWLAVTGKGIRRPPTDNVPMLRALAADPQVIKATRIETLWGVTNLMDRARAAAPQLPRPTLVLYGEHDRIIPREAFCTLLEDLPAPAPDLRLVLYARGWHMLTRDLQRERAMSDIAAWLANPTASLPSGEETARGSARLRRFCADGPAPDHA